MNLLPSSATDSSNYTHNQALNCIVYVGKQFHKSATVDQLQHSLGFDSLYLSDLQLREAANTIGLHSKIEQLTVNTGPTLPLPALIELEQQWWVLIEVKNDNITILDPVTEQTQSLSLSTSTGNKENVYKILLIADQELTKKHVKFGLSWFYPSIFRQKSQIRDLFLFAIVLQLFALVSPILFENIIDKVLVGRSLSSLHVLGMAMLAIALAEPLYSFMRNTVFGHMASQINSELSGRLYRHLAGLPLQYFKQRQTGQIIARVREMSQIRQFLTGSTLMLLLDLIFVIMFIGIMFYYAWILTWIVIGSLFVYFVFWVVAGPVIRRKVEAEYETDANATSFLTEAVTGIETIKTTATENRFLHQWQRILSQQLTKSFAAQKSGLIAGQGIDFVQKFTAAILLWWG